jgi:hypothetical protein
MEMMRDRGIIY